MLGRVIAVDFDGCICENKWPRCGRPNMDVIRDALREKENGSKLILWTCRSGNDLREAVAYCKRFGLTFDAVNENVEERRDAYMNECRKVWADEYWDDHAVARSFEDYAMKKALRKEGRSNDLSR